MKSRYWFFILALVSLAEGHAHGVGPSGQQPLAWHTKQITDVFTIGTAPGRVAMVDGKECLVGTHFMFKVRDEFAYDIDETVHLEMDVAFHNDLTTIQATYEENGLSTSVRDFEMSGKARAGAIRSAAAVLHRARFAGNSELGSDFSIARILSPQQRVNIGDDRFFPREEITLCGL